MWWNLNKLFPYTTVTCKKAKLGNYLKKASLWLLLWLFLAPSIVAQVTITPDAPGYCSGTELTLTYTGVWGPGSEWSGGYEWQHRRSPHPNNLG